MAEHEDETERLIEQAQGGDEAAREQLLVRHRARLRQMIAVRLDRRLFARLDPSDVVQEALIDAYLKLPDYLRDRPLPFYPWLRQVAWDRLVELHRRHLQLQKRSVLREAGQGLPLPDDSALQLADRLLGRGSSPSARAQREEQRERVQNALARLAPRDREVLAMRYLEQLAMSEIAAVLGITEGAVKVRHLRALQRFHDLLGGDAAEERP
jgi:RNA polymerase sigma-70 factor (ECF subfamily)